MRAPRRLGTLFLAFRALPACSWRTSKPAFNFENQFAKIDIDFGEAVERAVIRTRIFIAKDALGDTGKAALKTENLPRPFKALGIGHFLAATDGGPVMRPRMFIARHGGGDTGKAALKPENLPRPFKALGIGYFLAATDGGPL